MTYSAAMSNCWNISSSFDRTSQALKSCFFCASSVHLTSSNKNADEIVRASKLIENMCFHMQISKKEIPENCTKSQFPYCNDCEKLLLILLEYQKIMDNAVSKISAIVSTIQQTVAHDTLTRNSGTETEKFSNLRDLIADGYRNKLLMKKLIRQNIRGAPSLLLQPNFSPTMIIKDNSVDPTDNSSDSLGCNLVIKNVMSLADPSCPVTIKEEVTEEADSPEMNNGESDSDEEVYTVPLRKRRLLFENVEIYKCVGSNGRKCLQCSICSHSVPVPINGNKGDMTPYMKLKLHIQRDHKNQPAYFPRERRAPTFVCLKCNLSFTKVQMYREHKKVHPVIDELICDICGRPIKNRCHRNLLLHKFSHKNDKERMEAIAAGERVTKKTLLASKLNRRMALQKRKRNARRLQKQVARDFS